jgi:hypothetical protein
VPLYAPDPPYTDNLGAGPTSLFVRAVANNGIYYGTGSGSIIDSTGGIDGVNFGELVNNGEYTVFNAVLANDSGAEVPLDVQVVPSTYTGSPTLSDSGTAIFWFSPTAYYWDLQNLVPLPGSPTNLNDAGQVIGTDGTDAYVWTEASGEQSLYQMLPPEYQGEVWNIDPIRISGVNANGSALVLCSADYATDSTGDTTRGFLLITLPTSATPCNVQEVSLPSNENLDLNNALLSAQGLIAGIGTLNGAAPALTNFQFGLISDLNNDGNVGDGNDSKLKVASYKNGASADDIEKGTEYLFVNDNLSNGLWDKDDPDPLKPSTAINDDDVECFKVTCNAVYGAIWFTYPDANGNDNCSKLAFYPNPQCNPSERLTFPFPLSTTHQLPPKLYVRAEGDSAGNNFTAEVDGDLVMNFGPADKSVVWNSDKEKFTVVNQFGDKKFFQAARNYILENNTLLYACNWSVPNNSAQQFKICTMLEQNTNIQPYETYWQPTPKVAGLNAVASANPAATVILNGNLVAFSDNTNEVWSIYGWRYFIGAPPDPSRMTDHCFGRLIINGAVSQASCSNDTDLDSTGRFYKNTQIPVNQLAGPSGKYVASNGIGNNQFAIGYGSKNWSNAMGGLSTNYNSSRHSGDGNQMVGRWRPDKEGKKLGIIFTVSEVQGSKGGTPAVASAASQSGVRALSGGASGDLELFMLDSGNLAIGLTYMRPDIVLRSAILEKKMAGDPFYVNTYLMFFSTKSR